MTEEAPRKKRRHRRVRADWKGCGCPEGTKKVPTKGRGRGWACMRSTNRGGRFVAAVCSTEA